MNQRRMGRHYNREYDQARARRQRRDEQIREVQEIDTQESDQQETSAYEDSAQRVPTERENDSDMTLQMVHHLAHHRLRDARRRRDMIRSELIRLLTTQDFERGSSHQGAMLLRNLHMLQMASIGRDFNGNDFEMLS